MQGSKKEDINKERHDKFIIYISILAIIFFLAIISTALQNASSVQKCKNIVIYQNKIACFQNLAYSTNNASVCSYMNGSNEALCYQSLATKTGNESLCNNAVSSYAPIGYSCIINFVNNTGNIYLCNSLPEGEKELCYFYGAINSNNYSACEFAGANTSICSSSIDFSRALLFMNQSYCKEVSNNTNSTFVYSVFKYSKIKPNSTISFLGSSLSNMGYHLSARDFCYINLAQELSNSSYCSSLGSLAAQELCYRSIEHSYNSSQINYTSLLQACSSAGSYGSYCKNFVYISEAVAKKNVSICESIANQTLSWTCIANIARAYRNESYCGYISNQTANSACIIGATQNVSNMS